MDAFVEDLIEDHLYLANIIAHKYKHASNGLDFKDLVQEGRIGLITAVAYYDPMYGTKFSTYASIWIKQCITDALTSKSRVLRLPSHVVYNKFRIHKFTDQFLSINNFEPDAELISKALSIDRHLVIQILDLQTDKCGLSELDFEDQDQEDMLEVVENDDNFDFVIKGIKRLSKKEQMVLALKFGLMSKV